MRRNGRSRWTETRTPATRLRRLDLGNLLLDLLAAKAGLRAPRFALVSRDLRKLAASFDPNEMVPLPHFRRIGQQLLSYVGRPPWRARDDELASHMLGMMLVTLLLDGGLCRPDFLDVACTVRTDGIDLYVGPKDAPFVLRLSPLARVYVQGCLLQTRAARSDAPSPWRLLPADLATRERVRGLSDRALNRLCRDCRIPVPTLDALRHTAGFLLLEHYPAVVAAVMQGRLDYRPPLKGGSSKPVRMHAPRRALCAGAWGEIHRILLGIPKTLAAGGDRRTIIQALRARADESLVGIVADYVARSLRQGRPVNTARTYGLAAVQLLRAYGRAYGDEDDSRAAQDAVVAEVATASESTRAIYRTVVGHLRPALRARGIVVRIPRSRQAGGAASSPVLIPVAEFVRGVQQLQTVLPPQDAKHFATLACLARGYTLRLSEALGLRGYHLPEHEGGEVVVGRSKTRSGRRRRLPLSMAPSPIAERLAPLLADAARRPAHFRVVDLSWQRRLGREGISARYPRVVRRLGLPPHSLHDLRHSAASAFFLEHVAPRAIGHNPKALGRFQALAMASGLVGRVPDPQSPYVRWGMPELGAVVGHREADLTAACYVHTLHLVQWAIAETLPIPTMRVPTSAAAIWLGRSRSHADRRWGRTGTLRRLIVEQRRVLIEGQD